MLKVWYYLQPNPIHSQCQQNVCSIGACCHKSGFPTVLLASSETPETSCICSRSKGQPLDQVSQAQGQKGGKGGVGRWGGVGRSGLGGGWDWWCQYMPFSNPISFMT